MATSNPTVRVVPVSSVQANLARQDSTDGAAVSEAPSLKFKKAGTWLLTNLGSGRHLVCCGHTLSRLWEGVATADYGGTNRTSNPVRGCPSQRALLALLRGLVPRRKDGD